MSSDPLLQPYRIKHLELRNRIMSTAHEPAYSDDGLPKERYRLYHAEKAKGGLALTMTAGSAVVSADSPEAFGNLHAFRDEIVPWLQELSDAVHQEGAAVMMQITHLGRRTNWNKEHWLPVLSASPVREPAHRSFPKEAEDWDLERIIRDYGSAAERMQAGGLDGIEIEAYGHLFDSFWSPATNQREDEWGGSLVAYDSPGGSWNQSVNGSGLISSSACVWLPMKTGNLDFPGKKVLRLPAGWCKAERWIF